MTQAQILNPVQVIAETPTKVVSVGDEIELVFKVAVEKNWFLYSVGIDTACGPMPVNVTLEKHPSFILIGGLTAINDQPKHDSIFECDVKVFATAGELRQKIKVLSTDLKIKGSYEGQAWKGVKRDGMTVLIGGDLSIAPIRVHERKKNASERPVSRSSHALVKPKDVVSTLASLSKLTPSQETNITATSGINFFEKPFVILTI